MYTISTNGNNIYITILLKYKFDGKDNFKNIFTKHGLNITIVYQTSSFNLFLLIRNTLMNNDNIIYNPAMVKKLLEKINYED